PVALREPLDDRQGSSRKLLMDSRCVEHPGPREGNDHRRDSFRNRFPQARAKALPDASLKAVSHDCVSYSARHGYAQPPPAVISQSSRIQHKVFGLSANALALQTQELGTVMQPVGCAEALLRAMPGYPGCLRGIEALRRLRPLARRRLSTLRPPGVAMRAMNPWVRLRRRL